ncbi:hypothetical protein [Pseudonocardia nigra]|uniref:hypothetical protein n=1 Tax=Pseudonocardia nigra TaxID=1921578 RepID=UPI0027E30E4F|nr:hypothetical protein [Pseudonocardia nigra]
MGTATQHGDAASSDTTPLAGPGTRPVSSTFTPLGATCASVLIGSDGMPQALCNTNADLSPVVHLLDPAGGASVASLALAKGELFTGVYGYVDEADRLVAVDGDRNVVRVGHDRGGPDGSWRLFVAEPTPIGRYVDVHCGAPRCDSVVSAAPGYGGGVWFVTAGGTVGIVDTTTGVGGSIALPPGERIANSISTAPEGMAVATGHALYLVGVDGQGSPEVLWRREYDRGPGRKPGQLSWGTGATPTFFGPATGTDYVAITDNAVPEANLLVYRTATGERVCSIPVVDGTENSPIGSGTAVVVASTFGYPYPALPSDAGPSVPPTAGFTGGMTRVDIDADGAGCERTWTTDVRSAAVPKLSLADGRIYTVSRTGPGDGFEHTVIDAETGEVQARRPLATGPAFDTLQMAGNLAPGQVIYQPTVTGVHRVTPKEAPAADPPR